MVGDQEHNRAKPSQKKPNRNLGNIINDIGVASIKSAIALPQSLVGITDLATHGHIGKYQVEQGVDFNQASEIADSWYSKPQQAANQAVRQTDGVLDTAKAIYDYPSTISLISIVHIVIKTFFYLTP